MVLLYIYNKDASFLLKRDFSKRLLNDEFQNFGKRKNVKSVVSHLACTTGFFVLLYQVRNLLLVLHCLHDDFKVITTLQDDILQEV